MHVTTKKVKTEHLEVYTRFKYFSWHLHIDDVTTPINDDYIVERLIQQIASVRVFDGDIIIYVSRTPHYLTHWKEIKKGPSELVEFVNNTNDSEDKKFIKEFVDMIL